jgi:flagellar protein FliL
MADKTDKMADAESNTGAEAAPPKSKLKLIIIVVVGLLVLGGGTGGYLFFARHKEAHAAAPAVKPPAFVDVPEVLVNLSTTGSDRTHYLKAKIVLELSDAQLQPQVQAAMPRVMDAFQTYLRELRPTDLDGSAGLYRLKEELTRRVNASISPSKVNAVLFKEIVVQ